MSFPWILITNNTLMHWIYCRNLKYAETRSSSLTLLGCCGGGKGVYSFFSLVVTFFCLTFFLRISYKSNLKYKKYKQQKRLKEIDYIHRKKKIAIDVVLLEFRKKPIPVFVCKCWVLFKFFLHHKNLLRRERERERERLCSQIFKHK